ncbi:MAG TPA: ATP-binding cassette domain-containing protein [Streptosporangiaceae bacterium]|nr:ATP-binding cassette domain-containing protein [Streptosporangiaceae bacterium]
MTEVTLDPTDTAAASGPSAPPGTSRAVGARIDAIGVGQHAGERQILHEVSLSVEPGELIALAGGSGAGKTTLLEILAGLRAPSAGQVMHDGVRVDASATRHSGIGYVPQDDIIHGEMPLRRTLQYAARLRLPADTSSGQADRVVDEILRELDLADRRDVAVRMLSGGQRKRASIAVELLTRPGTFFLDEPTSGLDPSTSAEVVRLLRRLTHRGVTVVLTTHEPATIDRCDQVVFLTRNGHQAFAGTPAQARRYFGVDDLVEVYRRLASEDTPRAWAERFTAWRQPARAPARPAKAPARPVRPDDRHSPGVLRQWWLLTRRNTEVLVRNRLTLAILLGSPVLVTAMMAVLFRPGAFDGHGAADVGPAQIVFWVAFAGFFFGLTYGLLQIVGEQAIFRREHRSGLSAGAYVAAKVSVLVPVLAAVTAVLLGVLRALDRLPAAGWGVYTSLLATLLAEAVSALALGLLASAAVSNTAQAALALPMLCFPQVLFAGAVVPVPDMAAPGRWLSLGLANRYSFEALGRALGLDQLTGTLPAMRVYGDTFSGTIAYRWLVLAGFTGVFALATVRVLRRRSRPGPSGR